MSKEKNNKSKRSKAAQQKQKLVLTGVLAIVLVALVGVLVVVFGGAGKYASEFNTVYVLSDGRVVTNSVESFDENTYNKDELKNYIKEVVDTYNASKENAVKQKSLKVKEGTANLIMEYATADDFAAFEGTEIFCGSVNDAMAAGYVFDVEFANVTGGSAKAASVEEFAGGEYKVLIIKSNVTVSIEDAEICYVSAVNTASVEDGVVVIKDGANLLGNVSLEEETESTEETVDGTEIEGAISEDELVSGAEDESIVFDFGDEAESVNPYSGVYTYIIYK